MFWRGVFGYLPANAVQALVGVATIALFTRALTPAQYGAYALAFTAMNLCHTVAFTWIEAGVARFNAREAGTAGFPDHLATLYRCWLAAAFGLAVVAGVAALLWPAHSPVRAALAVVFFAVLARSLMKMAQERLRAAGEVRAFAALDMAQTAGGFLAALALIAVGGQAAGAIAGPGLMAAVCLMFVLPRELGRQKGGRFEPQRAKAYALYGVPIAASLVLVAALGTTDRFVLAAYLNETVVGVYHAGYSLANRTLDVMFIWLGMASAPALIKAFERGGAAAVRAGAAEQGSLMVALALPATVGLVLVAHPLADVMVGPALRAGAAHVTPWIAVAALFSGLTTYYLNPAFSLARRTGLLFAAMAVPALANIALALILIPRFGLDGALWATTASYGLGMICSFVLGRRALALPIPLAAMAKAALASLAMALVVLRLPGFGGALELLIKSGCGALAYALVAVALDLCGLRGRMFGWAARGREMTA